MDEQYQISTVRYVELNPVRDKFAKRPEDYTWGSAKAYLHGEEDRDSLRQHERTGRPMGSEGFLDNLEQMTGRVLKRQKSGPKKSN